MKKIILIIFSIIAFILVGAICVYWGYSNVSWAIKFTNDNDITATTVGSWGESFAPINTIFSGFAFIGLIITIFIQKMSFDEQIKDINKQKFDTTFFEMMKFLRENRSNLYYISKNVINPSKSNHVFPLICEDILEEMRKNGGWVQYIGIIDKNSISSIDDLLDNHLYESNEELFAPYFRIIFNILSKIDNERSLSDDEKIAYSRFLRSQFSTSEVLVLGINGLSSRSGILKYYIEKYRLLKYSGTSRLRRVLMSHYEASAFISRSDDIEEINKQIQIHRNKLRNRGWYDLI